MEMEIINNKNLKDYKVLKRIKNRLYTSRTIGIRLTKNMKVFIGSDRRILTTMFPKRISTFSNLHLPEPMRSRRNSSTQWSGVHANWLK